MDSGRAGRTGLGVWPGTQQNLHHDSTHYSQCDLDFQSTSRNLSLLLCKMEILMVPTLGAVQGLCEMTPRDDHMPRTSLSVLSSHLTFTVTSFFNKRTVRLREARWFSQGHTAGQFPACTSSALVLHRSVLSPESRGHR